MVMVSLEAFMYLSIPAVWSWLHVTFFANVCANVITIGVIVHDKTWLLGKDLTTPVVFLLWLSFGKWCWLFAQTFQLHRTLLGK